MKNWLSKLYRNRHFLIFIMMFGYVQSIYIRITSREEINAYTFTPEGAFFTLFQAAALFAIMLLFIQRWQNVKLLSTQKLLKIFGLSLIVFLISMKVSGLLISIAFDTVERNFNTHTFYYSLFSDFLNGLTYGSFFLAYKYFKQSKNHQEQLTKYNQALSESKIKQLKQQLNPHFLFNNLNVLDQLIDEDKEKASTFLNEFADIYRYVLQVSEKKTVSLNEEIVFAEQYFRLFQHKYGKAYQMNIECKTIDSFIVPLTLQLLIENAVHHNIGTVKDPIFLTIEVGDTISVSNNRRQKANSKSSNGIALKNLKEQYKLLTNTEVKVHISETDFEVIIPILPSIPR